MTTRSEAVAAAGRNLAISDTAQAQMTPREQAAAAYTPTPCPLHGVVHTVDELEDLIRAQRGLQPRARSA